MCAISQLCWLPFSPEPAEPNIPIGPHLTKYWEYCGGREVDYGVWRLCFSWLVLLMAFQNLSAPELLMM